MYIVHSLPSLRLHVHRAQSALPKATCTCSVHSLPSLLSTTVYSPSLLFFHSFTLSLLHSFTLSLSCSVQLLTALPFFTILYFLYSDVIPA